MCSLHPYTGENHQCDKLLAFFKVAEYWTYGDDQES